MVEVSGRAVEKLRDWVGHHPEPDEPLLVCGRKTYSPREILHEVEEGTNLGNTLYENFREEYKI